MLGSKVTVVYDVGGRASSRAEAVRQELLAALEGDEIKTYFATYRGKSVRSLGGTLVGVKFSDVGDSSDLWSLFAGLRTLQVRVEDGGNDHFPTAGLYHASTLPDAQKRQARGAVATVRWKSDTEYPAREELIESVVRAHATDSYAQELAVNVPVVVKRSWTLELLAPSLTSARWAYELLRGGKWLPRTTFVDAVPDHQKVRQVPIRFEPGFAEE